MFSNSAYEALYRYLGLVFHAGSIQLITSEPFFKGLILIIFGGLFLLTAWHYASNHIVGNLVERHHVPISKFVKITFCLVLGISILRVGATINVHDYTNQSWSRNPYVKERVSDVQDTYQVSFVFDILSRTAEEVSRYLSYAGDYIFGKGKDSYLKSPFAYTKAIMLAGASTIDDDKLRTMMNSYTNKCLQKALPDLVDFNEQNDRISRFFKVAPDVDNQLGKIPLGPADAGLLYTCRDLKEELREGLYKYTSERTIIPEDPDDDDTIRNFAMSSMLVNHFKGERESVWGLQKGAQVPGAAGTFFQYLNRLISWDAFVSIFSLGSASNIHGASEAAARANDFSETLARAPHLKGMVMMVLIGIFPWLIFFVVYGNWQILTWWFWIYFSVCLWTPIWSIMYHILQNLTFTGDALARLGGMNDGVSLYSSQVVLDRIYYLYSVFSIVQIAVPVVTTGAALYLFRPMFGGHKQESAPTGIAGAVNAGSTAVGVATGMPELGVAVAATK